jgi:hypothetical protein
MTEGARTVCPLDVNGEVVNGAPWGMDAYLRLLRDGPGEM